MPTILKSKEEVNQWVRQRLQTKLPEMRKGKGWSQDRLAKEAGLTTVGYGSIERGESIPSTFSVYKICRALGCTLDELFPIEELSK